MGQTDVSSDRRQDRAIPKCPLGRGHKKQKKKTKTKNEEEEEEKDEDEDAKMKTKTKYVVGHHRLNTR